MPERLHPVLFRIKEDITRYNKNWTFAIVGRVGSGKSWAALRIAELLDPSFKEHPSKRIVFSIQDLIAKVNREEITKGKIYILDECAISFSARDAMSTINKEMSAFLQSWRFMNAGLILTLPDLSFMDIVGRKLVDNIAVCFGYNKTTHITSMKFYDNAPDFFKGEPKKIFTRSRKLDGEIVKHRWLRVGLASQPSRRIYEQLSRPFKKGVSLKAEQRINELEEIREAKTYHSELKQTVFNMKNSGMTIKEIHKITGRPERTLRGWVGEMEGGGGED